MISTPLREALDAWEAVVESRYLSQVPIQPFALYAPGLGRGDRRRQMRWRHERVEHGKCLGDNCLCRVVKGDCGTGAVTI